MPLLRNTPPEEADARLVLKRLMRDVYMVASAFPTPPDNTDRTTYPYVYDMARYEHVLYMFRAYTQYASAKRAAYLCLVNTPGVFKNSKGGTDGSEFGYYFANPAYDVELDLEPEFDDTYLNLRAYVCAVLGFYDAEEAEEAASPAMADSGKGSTKPSSQNPWWKAW